MLNFLRLLSLILLPIIVSGCSNCCGYGYSYPPFHYTIHSVNGHALNTGIVHRYHYGNGKYSPYRHYHRSEFSHPQYRHHNYRHHNYRHHNYRHYNRYHNRHNRPYHRKGIIYHYNNSAVEKDQVNKKVKPALKFNMGASQGDYISRGYFSKNVMIKPYLTERLNKKHSYIGSLYCNRNDNYQSQSNNIKSCYSSLKYQAQQIGAHLIILHPKHHMKIGYKAGCKNCVYMKGYVYRVKTNHIYK